jgi:predicted GNAT family acetyltransferase
VAAAGFDAPPDVFAPVMTERVLADAGTRAYVGEVDGEVVATAVGVTRAGTVGVFNVATLPAHRGRGYGAAITAQAARDGLGDGAEYAWLQSSPMGVRVYESIGFATLESWRCWLTPPPAGAEPVASRP